MAPPMMYGPPPKPKTIMPMLGGIFLIIGAIIGMAFWALVAFVAGTAAAALPVFGTALASLFLICGAIEIIFGILMLLGGIMAIRRKMWALALIGSILGLFTFGWYGLGSIFALIGLILIAISRGEFE